MASKRTVYLLLLAIALPIVALSWLVPIYTPGTVAVLVILYVIVSILNRRKFSRQEKASKKNPGK